MEKVFKFLTKKQKSHLSVTLQIRSSLYRGFTKGFKLILFTWFEHLEESFYYKVVQFKKFCLPVKISCPPAENFTETPALCIILFYGLKS